MKTLAVRLQWARTKKNLSQEALAKKAGVSQSTIGNLESGLRQTARRITAIADILEVNPMWLSDGKGSPEPAHGSSRAESVDAERHLSEEAMIVAEAFDLLQNAAQKEAVLTQLRAFGVLK
ncbi:helix-turn-helix domain-containing protein [Herbaspirillum frisingense]|uniref:Transcriptional regulator with XRE-family HTH domain n=1 Tax=Herbaspirillum frisingense TaxID=92645 RepID=A0ABU1PHX8_9BURK|nr:helix-turn-helix domain-containing protein [Herbaspirillum frisingense]MDR6585552.1 transcriptional regulator with XRE-family HTH domain [Herbaspirillum frisingense]